MSAGTYSDMLRALGQNESGNNYGFVSSLGYLGRFQFGEEALQAIGFYAGDGTWAIDFAGGWTAKAASFGVYDKASFLASAAAQDAAAEAWFGKVHEDLKGLDLMKYVGQTVGGIAITPSGLLAGAHLVGVWNLKSFLETGGGVNIRDGYGTPVSEYVQKFGGYDTPYGGSGGGSTVVTTPPVSIHQSLQGSDGADTLSGRDGDDTLSGGGGANVLRGEGGNDVLTGGWQFDDLHGGPGSDVARGGGDGDWVAGGQGEDQLFGEEGHDVVYGNMGQDTVDGGGGNDWVRGGQGDDVVRGDWGDDFIAGDRGSDTVSGGGGADLFHFFSGAGLDRVTDFNVSEGDRVDVEGSYNLAQVGADTVIDLGAGDQMVLVGVQLSGLPDGWIF